MNNRRFRNFVLLVVMVVGVAIIATIIICKRRACRGVVIGGSGEYHGDCSCCD